MMTMMMMMIIMMIMLKMNMNEYDDAQAVMQKHTFRMPPESWKPDSSALKILAGSSSTSGHCSRMSLSASRNQRSSLDLVTVACISQGGRGMRIDRPLTLTCCVASCFLKSLNHLGPGLLFLNFVVSPLDFRTVCTVVLIVLDLFPKPR